MNCEHCRNLMIQIDLDDLSRLEDLAFHLASCDPCMYYLERLGSVAEALLPPQTPADVAHDNYIAARLTAKIQSRLN